MPTKINNKIAVVRGINLPISTKHSIAICRFIKGKSPNEAIFMLEQVIKKRIAVPMKGEIPHRHNMPKGRPQGRYPSKASQYFIKMLKNLNANASIKGLASEELKIITAKANKGGKYIRATRIAYGRKRKKQSHALIEAVEVKNKDGKILLKTEGKNKNKEIGKKEKAEIEKKERAETEMLENPKRFSASQKSADFLEK